MTVIAWDGKSIAADKQATNIDMRATTTKLKRLESGIVLGWTGGWDYALALVEWFEGKREWPKFQEDKDKWSRLIVVENGIARMYEQETVPLIVEDPFMAWGSGRDFAMGAMAMGATAKEAVEVANRFCTSCGLGVDVIECAPTT